MVLSTHEPTLAGRKGTTIEPGYVVLPPLSGALVR